VSTGTTGKTSIVTDLLMTTRRVNEEHVTEIQAQQGKQAGNSCNSVFQLVQRPRQKQQNIDTNGTLHHKSNVA